MKTQIKIFSVLAAALAVVFFSASVSLPFNVPGEMANCRAVESGLRFECDPVSNLAVVNTGVIPVTGLGLPSFTTSLRSVNDFAFAADDLTLSDSALAVPEANFISTDLEAFLLGESIAQGPDNLSLGDSALAVPEADFISTDLEAFLLGESIAQGPDNLSLSDFALTLPAVPILGLSDFAISAIGLDNLSLSDFALTLPVVPVVSLSDFAVSYAGLDNLSLSDFAISAIGLDNLSLSDFAISQQIVDEGMMELPLIEPAFGSGMYGLY